MTDIMKKTKTKLFGSLLTIAALCIVFTVSVMAEDNSVVEDAPTDTWNSETDVEDAPVVTADASTTFEDSSAAETTESQLYYVTDEADILTDDEDLQLEEMAETVSKEYGIGVYIVTLDDYQNYGTGDVYEVTYGIYHEYTMGEGEGRDGIMLLLSMYDRDWAMFCYGENCEYAFNEYGQEQLESVFLDNFGEDDWYGGFADYIGECESYMQQAAAGKPVSASPKGPILIMSAFVLFITLLIIGGMWISMNDVAKKTNASNYISGSLNLTGKSDTFTHRTETRRRIETSSSGGGSHSHSGGGGSGRSGKF